MTSLEARLYFTTPPLSHRDIRIALQLLSAYGDRPGFLSILQSQAQTFDNYTQVYDLLKGDHGQKESQTKTVKEAQAEDKALEGTTFQEKNQIGKTKKKFQARILHVNHPQR